MNAVIQQSFLLFKPSCDKLASSASFDALKDLQLLVKSCPDEILEVLQKYVLLPIVVHLGNKRFKEEFRCCLVDTIELIFKKTHVESPEIFLKCYSGLVFQIYEKGNADSVSACSEELKLSVVKSITALFLCLLPEVRKTIYKRENAPRFGQGIFLCVQIAKKEQYRKLRIEAIQCMQAISSLHDENVSENAEIEDPVLESVVGDMLMFFLPGVLGALQDIANGDEKQGMQVTVVAITTMYRMLCTAVKDHTHSDTETLTNEDFLSLIKNSTTDEQQTKTLINSKSDIINKLKTGSRDEEWYKNASEKLVILVESLVPLCSHSHDRVRLELAVFCGTIITKCARNMAPSMKHILKILITLSEDEDYIVMRSAKQSLQAFSTAIKGAEVPHLMNTIEDNLNKTLTALPRHLTNLDSNKKLASLNLLCGYLRILSENSENLVRLVSCEYFRERLLHGLIEAVKLETMNIHLLEECSVRDIEAPITNATPWKCFTYLTESKALDKIVEICHIVGGSEAVDTICDHLFQSFADQNEIIFLLNEIITGRRIDSATSQFSKNHLIRQLIESYTDPGIWYQPITVTKNEKLLSKNDTLDVTVYNPRSWEKEYIPGLYEGATETRYTDISYNDPDDAEIDYSNDSLSLSDAKSNVLQICLMTEGIGLAANYLRSAFQPYLLKMLYLILERAGSPNEMIHLSGMKALSDITRGCDLHDITDLIRINSDYFTYQVTMKLKKINGNTSALQVLTVVMNYSDVRILHCLYHIVINVLTQNCGVSEVVTLTYLRVFHTFIRCIRKWFPVEIHNETTHNIKINERGLFGDVFDYIRNKESSEKLFESDKDTEMTAEEMYQEDLKKKETDSSMDVDEQIPEDAPKLPQHIEMVVTVLRRCLNFMPATNRDQKLLVLETINDGIILLKDYEDELLPLVHSVWSPLVIRFTELSQPVVLNSAFRVLVTLGIVSKDFIQNSVLKEVLPSICKFLKSSSKDSYLKDIGSWYRHSQAYKLQVTLLEGFGNLAVSLKIQGRNLYDVLSSVEVYLNEKQPKTLQKSACNFFKTLMAYDPDMVFLHLKSLYSQDDLAPPQNVLNLDILKVKLIYSSCKNDYKKNVTELLNYYENIEY